MALSFTDRVLAALARALNQTDAYNGAIGDLTSGSGGGTTNFLRADGTWQPAGGGGGGPPTGPAGGDLTGTYPNPTIGAGKVVAADLAANAVTSPAIAANAVGNAALAQAPALTVKCNPTNATANDQDFAASSGNQVLQTNGAGTALTWGPFGTGVQVRGATWQGGNSPIVVGNMQDVSVVNPIDMKVTRVSITTKVFGNPAGTGSCTCDVWTGPIASYPPTSANTIFGVLPAVTSAADYDDTVLSGLITAHIPAGNVLTFHLVSSSIFTEVVLNVALTPTQTVASTGYTDAQAVAAVKAAMTNVGNVLASGAVGAITLNTGTGTTWGANSIAASGYVTFPMGLIMQWGSFAAPSAGATTVTFPLAFPNACFAVVPSQAQSTSYGYPFSVASKSTTQFVTDAAAVGGIAAGTLYYIALGY